MYSGSTFYAQNPALEIVDQQNSVSVYLHIHVQRECSAEEPFMRSILCHEEHLTPVLAYAHIMSLSHLGDGIERGHAFSDYVLLPCHLPVAERTKANRNRRALFLTAAGSRDRAMLGRDGTDIRAPFGPRRR